MVEELRRIPQMDLNELDPSFSATLPYDCLLFCLMCLYVIPAFEPEVAPEGVGSLII